MPSYPLLIAIDAVTVAMLVGCTAATVWFLVWGQDA
jgi:hypothetical protein